MQWIYEPWPWYIAGPIIALIMMLLIFFGESLGLSSNFRTVCTLAGAGKYASFFKFDWKAQRWNLMFVLGAILGGALTSLFFSKDKGVEINSSTVSSLEKLGFSNPGSSYLPEKLFGMAALSEPSGIILLILGGFLVGFGARYAGGCTSGHAISGLSNLQLPSLIAVIGFFIGGLIMTYMVFPLIF